MTDQDPTQQLHASARASGRARRRASGRACRRASARTSARTRRGPATDATAPYAPPAPVPPVPPAPGGVPTFVPPQAAGDAVATAPVVAASAPKKRRSPLKWVVALVDRRPGRRLGRRRRRAAHRRVGHAVGPRLDPERQRHLRRGPARPPRQPAGRARQGPQRVPGLRRPGRVPDQDQRGPRPARRQGVRRQAELHGRHPALVRRPARRQRRTPADRGRRLGGALPRPRERQGRRQGHGLGRGTTLAGDRRHLDHRDVQRRRRSRSSSPRPTSASWPRRSSSPTP